MCLTILKNCSKGTLTVNYKMVDKSQKKKVKQKRLIKMGYKVKWKYCRTELP